MNRGTRYERALRHAQYQAAARSDCARVGARAVIGLLVLNRVRSLDLDDVVSDGVAYKLRDRVDA